jgi:hypothetical protein
VIDLANVLMRPSLTTPAHAFSLREPSLLDEPDQGTPSQRVGTTTKVVFQSHFREYTILSMVMVDITPPPVTPDNSRE